MMKEDKTLVGGLGVLLAVVDLAASDTFSPSLAFNLFRLLNSQYGASTTQKADFGLNHL